MRLLSLRGRNLASLHGDFAIDFCAEPLRSAGLFAISGPTGSGKSTLLDAICLALYGDTPRYEGKGSVTVRTEGPDALSEKDPRWLLSRGAAEGFAEVAFQDADRHPWRARWSVRRARERVDGRLQPADMVLMDGVTGDPVASGLREAQEAIQERIGLTFEQFRRAVMLAQGEFAAFLKADPNERSALLEKITGTEIYARLGKAAHERAREEREALARLDARMAQLGVLSAEEREQAEALRQREKSSLDKARADHEAVAAGARWWRALRERERVVAQAKAVLEQAEEKDQGAQAAREALGLARRVREQRGVLEGAEVARAQVLEAERRANEALRIRDERKERLDQEEGKVEGAARELSVAEEARHKAQPQFDEALKLDQALEGASEAVSRGLGVLKDAEREAGRHPAPEAREGDPVGGDLEAWIEAARADAASAAKRAEADDVKALAEQRAALQGLWQEVRSTTVRAAELKGELAEVAGRLGAAEAELVHAGERVEALVVASARAEGALEHARKVEQALRSRASLAVHREHLVDGEPCPLCGATEHPWALQVERDEVLVEAQRSLAEAAGVAREAKADEEGARQKQASLRSSVEGLKAQVVTLEARLAAARTSWADLGRGPVAQAFAWPEDPCVPGDLLERIVAAGHQARTALQEAQDRAEAASAMAEEVRRRERLQAHRQAASKEGEARVALDKARQEHDDLVRKRAALFGGAPVEEVRKKLKEDVRDAESRRDAIRKAVSDAKEALAQAQAHLETARLQRDEALQKAADAKAARDDVLSVLGVSASEAEAILGRAGEALDAEQARLDGLRGAVQTARGTLGAVRAALADHESQRPEGLGEEDELLAAAATSEAAVETAQARFNEAHRAVRNDDERRAEAETLREERDALAEAARPVLQVAELIGSAQGDVFRRFAQQLTLDRLVGLANRHLDELHPRYRLERIPGEAMALQVRDREQGDEIRGLRSLSGGETFLTSLALALALADLAPARSPVQTLFIDEGFGTLDRDTLDAVLAVLSALQATGRTVGVISHVAGLSEAIGVQVVIERLGGGRSRVIVPQA